MGYHTNHWMSLYYAGLVFVLIYLVLYPVVTFTFPLLTEIFMIFVIMISCYISCVIYIDDYDYALNMMIMFFESEFILVH